MGELFLKGAHGNTFSRLLDTISIIFFMALQHGVPLGLMVDKLMHRRFEPAGMVRDPKVRVADSISDYIAKWLKTRYMEDPDGSTTEPHGRSVPEAQNKAD